MQVMSTDHELMAAFRKGEGLAFEKVYHQFVGLLLQFTDKIVRDTLVAEDIVIEVFGKGFNRHADFDNLAKLKSFLFVTANNAAVDYIRTKKRQDKAHQELKYLHDEMDDSELIYIKAEADLAVSAAIDALPAQAREVIQKLFIQGKKLPEIAAEMEISYNTVQNYRARGLELMRLHLLKNKWLSLAGLHMALSLVEKKLN